MTEHKRCGCVEQYHASDCPACRGTGLIPPVTAAEWDTALRAGRAEGWRDAAEFVRMEMGWGLGNPVFVALLARAEEVER